MPIWGALPSMISSAGIASLAASPWCRADLGVTESAVKDQHSERENNAEQPRHDVELATADGLLAGCWRDIEGPEPSGQGWARSLASASLHQLHSVRVPDPKATDRWASAAKRRAGRSPRRKRTLKLAGTSTAKQDSARLQQAGRIRLVADHRG